ncbi:hypothetical protein PLIIFM63780_006465 [Purpureocillium lilacinum]|nr:hypothetical protein PLIIFM63780_006465 [Purpureocillium lilacinum]
MPRRRKNRHRGNHGGSRGDNGGNRSGSGWNRNTSRTMFAASSDPGDLFRAQIEEDAGSSESPITYESLHREIDWLGLKVRAFNDATTHSPAPTTSRSDDGSETNNIDNKTKPDATGVPEESPNLQEMPFAGGY